MGSVWMAGLTTNAICIEHAWSRQHFLARAQQDLGDVSSEFLESQMSVEIFADAGHQLIFFEMEAFTATIHDFWLSSV
jgi:hypothetical protein